jgi:CelD/BcsL family acetyltransferase involved in cellulose biosynthesis
LSRVPCQLRADRGWLRSYVLTCGDVPVCFIIGAQDDATYYYERIGYDPTWHEHSPGKVLLFKVIEDMYAERTPKWFDFGTGDSEYKRVFGTEQYDELNVYLLRKSVYMAAARATHSSVGVVDRAVRRVLDRYQLRQRVRHLLRGRKDSAAIARTPAGEDEERTYFEKPEIAR